MIVIVAGVTIGAIWFIDATEGESSGAAPEPTAAAIEGPVAIVALTSNIYGRPTRTADLVAIVPEGRTVRVSGRTDDSEWLRIIYPVTSALEGWVPAANMIAAAMPDLAAVPAVASIVQGEDGEVDGGLLDSEALPDLTVSSADVQSNGQLAVRITNVGRAPFAGQVGLRITTADGEIVGVLDVDLEASPLGPGRSASINTGTVVAATGLYVIEVDPANDVVEASEFNNTRRVLLVGTGG
ncbi:MAG: CARDB domain-containing protein [Dehalococcoidia bacterium]|nr:CARDB domain-containing protein [Dehalococcoidia bacterium]